MFFQNIEVSGIRRIVIRRQIVWELKQHAERISVSEGVEGWKYSLVWVKTAGGPGFKKEKVITAERMKKIVNKLLEKMVTTGRWQGHDVVAEQYRAWIHGDTLNIVEIRRGEKKITVRREVR